ncbi:Subunit of heteropentameric Replication factor C (RF-C) [Asimina triloba]
MAETTGSFPMEIDEGFLSSKISVATKGKSVVTEENGTRTIPWVEKYRPQSLADVAAHRDIVNTIDRLTNENRLPHLLLYGPPGTGKTSTILAVARKLYGSHYQNMILELNASDDRGIDVVRQQIQDFASTQSFSFGAKSPMKLILLDEADAMTKDAQFALRRVIERYTKTTSLDVTEGGLVALVRLSSGDMRKALNILQSTQMASPHVTEEAVYLCTGNPMPKDIEQISSWLLNESFATSFKCIQQLVPSTSACISEMKMRKGLGLVDIVREVTMFVFQIKMPADVRVQLINDLADIEYRLSFGCNDKLQLGSLVSCFTYARAAIVAAAQ